MGLLRRTQRRGRDRDAEAGDGVGLPTGDRAAFAAVYDHYADVILRYCRVRIDDPGDAEDAAALVFTRALAAFPPRDGGSLRSWLFAIAHNVVANHYRSNHARALTRPLDAAAALADPTALPDEAAVRSDERRALWGAIARLPDDQRRVIELRLAGLTGPEIAGAMDRSHAAVKMLQLRAVDRLRGLLAPPSRDDPAEPTPSRTEDAHARRPR